MRKIIGFLAAFFALALPVFAQSTVTATVTDPDSTAWATLNGFNATYSLQLVNSAGALVPQGQAYRIDTGAVVTVTAQGLMDASGTFSVAIASSNNITPAGTKWKVQVCPAVTSAQCNTVTLPINASGTYSSQLSAGTIAPRIGGGIGNYAYNDTEVAAIPNNSYLNITGVAALRCYSTSWGGCGGSSSSGFPFPLGTSSISAAGPNLTLNGLTTLQSVIYLSAASDIGAQCTTALTTLGSAGGLIVFPNSTNIPMSTTCANIPQSVSFKGYGKLGSNINCTVAGDCFGITQNPTTNGEIGGKFSDFEINGSGASNQVLIHGYGASGWTFDNIQFTAYATGSNATCLEFENNGNGIFSERNTVLPSVYFERECAPSLYIHQSAGDTSFAYNYFDISGVSQGANFLVIADGGARLYGGTLKVRANFVGTGVTGGIVEFNGTSGSGTGLDPSEFLDIMAEGQGTPSNSVVVQANSTGALNFEGALINGPGGAVGLGATLGGAHSANFHLTDVNGNYRIPLTETVGNGTAVLSGSGSQFGVVGSTSTQTAGYQYDNSALANGKIWETRLASSNPNQWYIYDRTDSAAQLVINYGAGNTSILEIPHGAFWCWYGSAGDTGFSSSSAGTINIGNCTGSDSSAAVNVGKINVAGARKGTFVCTNGGTITITNSNETATSDVNISMNTAGGTITTPPSMKTVTAATGFTVLCGATDTSTYNYDILN